MAKLYAVVLLALVAIVPAQKAFDGYKVVSVTPSTEEQLDWLLEVREIYNLDFWTEPRGINKPFDILLPPYLPQLPREINERGIVAEIRIRDVQDLIDQQNPSSVKIPRSLNVPTTYKKSYKGYMVITITPKSQEEIDWMLKMREIYFLDFWTEPRGVGKPFDVMLPPHLPHLKKQIKNKGIHAEIKIRDVQELIDSVESDNMKQPRKGEMNHISTYKKSYEGYMVVQITPKSEEEIEWLLEMRETYYLDFWTEPHGVGQPFDVMLPPYLPHLKKEMNDKGIHVEIKIRDVQDLMDSQEANSIKQTRQIQSNISPYKKSYRGYMVVQITPKSQEEIDWMLKIREIYFLDFWTEPHGVGKPFEVMLPPHLPHLKKQIKNKGIHAEIMIRDVQELIDMQESDSIKHTRNSENISTYKKSYKGYMVVEITPKSQEEIDWMLKIREIYFLDFWTEPHGVGKPFDVMLPPYFPHLKTQIKNKGIHAEIKIRDVQKLIDMQESDSIKHTRNISTYKKSYKGYMVVEITPKSQEEIDWMLKIREIYFLDFWTEPHGVGKPFDVMLPPHLPHLKNQINKKGIHAEIKIRDVQELIDLQESNSIKHTRGLRSNKKPYERYMLVSLTPSSEEQIKWLLEMRETYYLDFWTEPNGVNKPFDVLLPPHLPHLKTEIKEKGIISEIKIRNVQTVIDQQNPSNTKHPRN